MIKSDHLRGVSPYSAKKKPPAKSKEEQLQVSGLNRNSLQARMVGASAPPRPAYLGSQPGSEDKHKFAASGKKPSVKRQADKIDLMIAAKAPKTKAGPTNGAIFLEDNNVLETVGFHSSPGRSDGRTKTNQDAFFIDLAVQGDKNRALIGVFDGHGFQGHKVSNFLIHNIREVLQLPPLESPIPEIAKTFTDTCHNLNNMLKKCTYIDSKLSGSTGVMTLIEPGRVTCSNVGDSRAVLFFPNGNSFTSVPLSIDQKPSDPQEKTRILSHGGKVHPSRRRFVIIISSFWQVHWTSKSLDKRRRSSRSNDEQEFWR